MINSACKDTLTVVVCNKVTMLLFLKPKRLNLLINIARKAAPFLTCASRSICQSSYSESELEVDRLTKLINEHMFPDQELHSTLQRMPPLVLSTTFVEKVLGRLFAAHSNGLRAYEFFTFCLHHSQFTPSSDAFEKTLHILARMRYFDKAWDLMKEIQEKHPSLLTLKSMSILLSKIAKFQTYEETLEAFERMKNDIFVEKEFGVEEFNVLLKAFCTQRQMKEARSIFQKMHAHFSPNTKTMNILLLGFKESGDVTAVELFYHDMVRRGFKPNIVTYNIRIDAYCKKGCFGDGLRLLQEMEKKNCPPNLETITTLIHGAGVARNISKARQLFDEISLRNIQPDVGAYNAFMSSLIRCRDVKYAASLMDEMQERHIEHDNITYHTMFFGLMRSASIEDVCELYQKMVERKFVPKTRTVMMLMKYFCVNDRLDLGLNLWMYLIERGYCPHGHALDLLVTGLCSRGKLQEAFECSKQVLERGRHMSEAAFLMLERFLVPAGETDRLRKLDHLIKKLNAILPPSRGHAVGITHKFKSPGTYTGPFPFPFRGGEEDLIPALMLLYEGVFRFCCKFQEFDAISDDAPGIPEPFPAFVLVLLVCGISLSGRKTLGAGDSLKYLVVLAIRIWLGVTEFLQIKKGTNEPREYEKQKG
ncbi:Pentatricopeptide repeat [Dillenia turbinata]|uniref:Pentatricopeptide repeat n=1 Tax=Dillenia turbinata TaxID=194707 RepID=A0AAN8ZBU4_9MAGN